MLSLVLAQAQTATSSTPWWGVPLIAGFFTILGVALNVSGNYFSDRRRAKREDAQRWDKEAIQTCASFTKQITAGLEILEKLRLAQDPGPAAAADTPPPDRLPDIEQHWIELQMIAPANIVPPARELVRFYKRVDRRFQDDVRYARGRTFPRPDHDMIVELRGLRALFIDAVRENYRLEHLPTTLKRAPTQ